MQTKPLNFGNVHARIINELPKVFKALQDEYDAAHAAGEEMPHLYFRLEFIGMINGESGVAGMDVAATASADFLTVASADGLAPHIEEALNVIVAAEQARSNNQLFPEGDEDAETQSTEGEADAAAGGNADGNTQLY